MPPQNNPDRIRILFDDHRLVANADLLLPATLARHLGACGNSSTITLTSAARRPVPSSPSAPDTAITPSSPTAMGRRWNWRPIIAATPRSRTPYATSSTASG